jgi:Zn-dependent protease with chaperone function
MLQPTEGVEAGPDYPDLRPCPSCGAAVPDGPTFTTWCDGCGWNVDGGDPADPRPRHVFARLHQRIVDRAAGRVHARLAAAPDDVRSGSPRRAAVALASAVILGCVLAVAGIAWWALTLPGWWRLVALGVLAFAVVALAPRPARLDDRSLVVEPDVSPHLHALVDDLAGKVGVATPAEVRVDTSYNMAVLLQGWRLRPTLLIGLPLWSALEPAERLAILGHELGHLRGRDTHASQVVWAGQQLLHGITEVLWPFDADEHIALWSWRPLLWVTNAFQRLVALPFLGLSLALSRLDATTRQRNEYLADRRATAVAGTEAMVAALAGVLGPDRGLVSASAAMRRGEDPWSAFEGLPRRPEREVERLCRLSELEGHHAGDSHPPTHLRIALVREGRTVTAPALDPACWSAVETEMDHWRRELRPQLEDDLLLQ